MSQAFVLQKQSVTHKRHNRYIPDGDAARKKVDTVDRFSHAHQLKFSHAARKAPPDNRQGLGFQVGFAQPAPPPGSQPKLALFTAMSRWIDGDLHIANDTKGQIMSTAIATRTILHVDDDPAVLRVVKHHLEKLGFEVVSVSEPAAAVDKLLNSDIRVVLLDVDMPGTSGIEMLREIKRIDGGVQVVMLTGVTTMQCLMNAFHGGADACFFKPIDDYQPLASALTGAFQKIEHWRSALVRLIQLRRANHEECKKMSAVLAQRVSEPALHGRDAHSPTEQSIPADNRAPASAAL